MAALVSYDDSSGESDVDSALSERETPLHLKPIDGETSKFSISKEIVLKSAPEVITKVKYLIIAQVKLHSFLIDCQNTPAYLEITRVGLIR